MHERKKQVELKRLTKIIREQSNAQALAALTELRKRRWLTDGSLSGSDLSGADLSGAYLKKANLRGTNLSKSVFSNTNLREANLKKADLDGAFLYKADLTEADLSEANLESASLYRAVLQKAILCKADLFFTDLRESDLSQANLKETRIFRSNLYETKLDGADFTGTIIANNLLGNVDLSVASGLDMVEHRGPTSLSVDSLFKSHGNIPEVFLRGCGVPPEFIEHTKGLFGEYAIRFYKCFISYSHTDKEFTRRLGDRLYGEGINFWLDEHDLKVGDFVADTIDQEIRSREKLIVCCSEYSLNSLWVDREVNTALQEEEFAHKETGKKVSLILPLDLDGYVFKRECRSPVATRLRERLVADFKDWKDHDNFEREVQKVIKALRTNN